ncbi:MAG: OB-fold nucleic acid binding domain-containing protein [Candidatus Woesearchaeota archaeon]
MINIPFETILEKLRENGLSDDEINVKIKQKMDQLSGLISKEGAAHIIANEMGIKLVEKTSGQLKIKDIMPGMRNIDTVGKVTNIFDIREFQRQNGDSSKVGSLIVGDETGTLRIVCWGSQADNLSKISKDDIVKIVSAYVRENQGRKELHLNDNSKFIINPAGESIGDISFQSREFDKKKISELTDNLMNIEILGTVVGVDSLRFFEIDPVTKKRARLQRDQFIADGKVVENPDYSYVMNAILDDGSGNIRCVLFGDLVEKSLNLEKVQLIALKDTPDIANIKNQLLGNIIKVKGRVKKNQMFDRLEFSVQDIDLKPDPYEEMEDLDKQIESVNEV